MAQQVSDKGEEPRRSKTFVQFKGVNTRSSRISIPGDTWFYLENMQPIGDANVHSILGLSAALYDFTSNTIYVAQYANVAGVDYLITASTNGNVYAYNIGTSAVTTIGTGFAGSGTRFAQWKNTHLLTFDNTVGYGYWNGSGTFTFVSGAGVPTGAVGQINDIAVAFGRAWICTARAITFTDVPASGPPVLADFSATNGAGTVALTDPTIRNNITRLWAQNGYLYIIAPTSISVISDVYVPSGASPPTPLFTLLNIQATIGSDQQFSIFAFNQALMFANSYGVWALYGTQCQRISEDIDGTWQYRDTSQAITGGAVLSNNLLSAAFCFKRLASPGEWPAATVLAVYTDKKWWFANYGSVTGIINALKSTDQILFGLIGNKLYQLFAPGASPPAFTMSTPLWPMEDNLADKEVIRAGFEAIVYTYTSNFNVTIDTVNNSQSAITSTNNLNIAWANNTGIVTQWQNNTPVIVYWGSNSYLLYNGFAPGTYGKYVGMTISGAAGNVWQFSSLSMDYKLRARWN
jgi:hypothetical protein